MVDNIENVNEGSVLVDIKDSQWPLVISFAGLGDQFQFKNILSSFNVNVIYMRDLKHNWYLKGIPEVGVSVNEIVVFLKGYISKSSFSKVITVGASAGGFAALLYGSLLKVDAIMALSPQTFVDRFHRFIYWDRRWNDRIKQIYSGNKESLIFFDVKNLLNKYNGSARIFYDKNHRLDSTHARRLTNNNIQYFASDRGGHVLAKYLKDAGKLKEYIGDIIDEK